MDGRDTYGGICTKARAERDVEGPQTSFINWLSDLIQSPTEASTQSGTAVESDPGENPPTELYLARKKRNRATEHSPRESKNHKTRTGDMSVKEWYALTRCAWVFQLTEHTTDVAINLLDRLNAVEQLWGEMQHTGTQ